MVVDNGNKSEHQVHLNNIFAEHNVTAATRAFAAARCEGIVYDDIVKGLGKYRTSGFWQNVLKTKDGICLYLDCFNAIASLVRSAIAVVERIPVDGRRVVVLGDIEECGEEAVAQHDECMAIVNESTFDVLLTVGEKMNAALSRCQMKVGLKTFACNYKKEVENILRGLVRTGDLVLLKSSHSGGLGSVVHSFWPSSYKETFSFNKDNRCWKFFSAIS